MLTLPEPPSFPAPPAPRQGWPWRIDQNTSVQGAVVNELPRITIITPSYNQGQYLEETIRSVLLQGYPNLEYFVVDGGSTDNSSEIIQQYAPWLSWWVSECDDGQAQAINKGLAKATGEIIGYLNSDDLYKPGCLFAVAESFQRRPDADWLIGDCDVSRDATDLMYVFRPSVPSARVDWIRAKVPASFSAPQPSTFWRSKLFSEFGPFDESMHYFFDHEFMMRLGIVDRQPVLLDRSLAIYRWHEATKSATGSLNFVREREQAAQKWLHQFGPVEQRMILDDCHFALLDSRMTQIQHLDFSRGAKFLQWLWLVARQPDSFLRRATWATLARLAGLWH